MQRINLFRDTIFYMVYYYSPQPPSRRSPFPSRGMLNMVGVLFFVGTTNKPILVRSVVIRWRSLRFGRDDINFSKNNE